MLSPLNPKGLPIHVLLPVHSVTVLRDDVTDTDENDGEQWCGSCGSTIVDDVAPTFRSILEENLNLPRSRSPSSASTDDDEGSRLSNFQKRQIIDDRLCELLKNLEDSWQYFKICASSEVHLKEEKCATELLTFASKLRGAAKKAKAFTMGIIQPIILVPDFEVHMLPWESLPVLKSHEVYRMPSVWSILTAYENDRKINPLDSYYLLDPAGDLHNSRYVFEKKFKEKKLKGKIGHAPTVEELLAALENRDLFIYIGHGNGSKYVPNQRIANLQKCAGALLMGCSSASLKLNGCYLPQGAPLLSTCRFSFHFWPSMGCVGG